MTPPPCVRGCTTAATDSPSDAPRIPKPATEGHLCSNCASRLWENLVDITTIYPHLTTDMTTKPQTDGSSHQKISGSPALIRLDVAVITDPKAAPGDGVYSVPGQLALWAKILRDDNHIEHLDTADLTQAMYILGGWWEQLLEADWVDEFWTEVRQMRGMVSRAANWPPAIGRCTKPTQNGPCSRTLYVPEEGGVVQCERCQTCYSGMNLVRLDLAQETLECSPPKSPQNFAKSNPQPSEPGSDSERSATTAA